MNVISFLHHLKSMIVNDLRQHGEDGEGNSTNLSNKIIYVYMGNRRGPIYTNNVAKLLHHLHHLHRPEGKNGEGSEKLPHQTH
jgi:hypothetical protein